MICENISVKGVNLNFADFDVTDLAKKYGTPLYLMDENRIRYNCRTYMKAMNDAFGEGSKPLFASKACCFKRIYEIMKEEGMSIDLVSPGEIFTAVKAGFPMENSYFHGNNKTAEEISLAIDCGVGCFIVDNRYELDMLNEIAGQKGVVRPV